MICTTNKERGTVVGLAALSQALDDEHVDGEYFLIRYELHSYLWTDGIPYALSL
jgi:hypothetical protein